MKVAINDEVTRACTWKRVHGSLWLVTRLIIFWTRITLKIPVLYILHGRQFKVEVLLRLSVITIVNNNLLSIVGIY